MITNDFFTKFTTPVICKEGRKRLARGTGFFFSMSNRYFVVTNRHLFVDEEDNFYPDRLAFKFNFRGTTEAREVDFDIYQKNEEKKWIDLGPGIDIAAIEFDLRDEYDLRFLSKGDLPPSKLDLGLGEQVLVIGYPKGFYDEQHNLPIARSASIASVYGVDFKGNPLFLIDSRLHLGTSGSPVFTFPNYVKEVREREKVSLVTDKWFFIGVNSGEFGSLQLNAVWHSNLILGMLENAPNLM